MSLVHKLLAGQLDGSDGLDAAHNTTFLRDLSNSSTFVNSLLYMCKQGSLESRHGALTVLQHFLVPKIWQQVSTNMRFQLITLGVLPMLLEVANSPAATAEMRVLADTCLQGFQGDELCNNLIGAFGMRPLVARLIGESVRDTRAANQDHRSR